jgi:uncharacterized membrane protein YcfT
VSAGPENEQIAPAGADRRARLQWVDAGRGISILLVVLYHSTNWLIVAGVHVEGWVEVNRALATLRMPLFFAISGLFAGKWLVASWADLWTTKLRLFIWVFLLWEVIGTVFFIVGLRLQGHGLGVRHGSSCCS